jgi:hypothetical protein
MPVESADDRAILLADFGVSITYTVQGGSAATITGIFDNEFLSIDAGGDIGFADQNPRVLCRTADVVNATEGDTFVIGGVTYLSRVVQDDGTGMTVIQLEKQ